jgi:hypothetical protein
MRFANTIIPQSVILGVRWEHVLAMVGLLVVSPCAGTGGERKVESPHARPVGTQEPIEVRLRKTSDGWELTRNGNPYFIRGVGGEGPKELLAKLGGNSIRTWGTENLGTKLDEAHRLGLAVAVGIWLGHERHGFKYDDAAQVAKQVEMVRKTIVRYKDHPGVLLWGLGNEMEGFGKGDKKMIWKAVNDIARLAKTIDPNHPTMTVIAEIGGERVSSLNRLCPDIDIVGINSYAGASTLPQRYRQAGGTKPYILTEFGTPGPWEANKTSWGAVVEPSSSEKAIAYRRSYQKAVVDAPSLCLGSYAFLWGHKQEATATWFGMLLPDGSRLASAEVLSTLWTGKSPPNRCPVIESLKLEGSSSVDPNTVIKANLSATDPENDPLTVRWILQADSLSNKVGGDSEKTPPTFPKAILSSDRHQAKVRMPPDGGAYRLFAYVHDGHGGAAVANIPLYVNGPFNPAKGASAKLPLVIYDEAGRKQPPYVPSGWMGNTKALKYDERWTTNPHSGNTCLRIDYTAADQWAAIAWQNPESNFGDKPGGWNLTGAKHLSVWLRGETGAEVIGIGLGMIGSDKKFSDSANVKLDKIKLSTEWREFRLSVEDKDMSRIITGLVFSVAGSGRPMTIYLDDCKYE